MIRLRDSRGEIGLSKLILIQSGVCDYFEIEPDQSTHLAGENGLGKTSILNSLQFLVIDDWKHMRFPRPRAQTEGHYFGYDVSTIIFELQTYEGASSMIVFRGLGPAGTTRFNRFSITGGYEKELFLDGNEPRSWQDVCTVASQQGREIIPFTTASQLRKHLRDVLKWLPTKDQHGVHSDFVHLLKTLNTLGSVKDKDLKEVLMNINHGIQRSVDFRSEYGDEWQRHLRRRRTITAFEMNSQKISKLEKAKSDFDEIGHQLSSLIDEIGPTIEYHNTNSPQVKEKFQEKISTHKSELEPIVKKEEELGLQISEVQSEISILGHEISELEETEKWISANSEKELSESLTVLFKQFSELKTAIDKSEQKHYTVEYINNKLQQKRTKISSNRRLLDKQKGTILHSMSEQKIAHDTVAMKLFNEKILSASGSVENPDDFSTLLTEIGNGIIDKKLNYRGLSIDDLEQLSSGISLDPKQLENECEILHLDIVELEKHLEIATNIGKSRTKLTEVESTIAKLQNEIRRFEKWENEESQQLPMKKNMVKEKLDSKAELSLLKDSVSSEKDAKLKMLEAIHSELNQYEWKLGEYNDSWKIIHDAFCPETAFRPGENFEFTELSDTLSKCSKLLTRYQKLDSDKSRIQNELYRELSELIHSSSHEQFITHLLDINAKLPEQIENAQKEWVHLISNIGRSASLMKESLRILNQEINSINRICEKIKFSNLDEFHVDFREQSSDIELMSSLTSFSEYSNDPETLQAIENLGEKCMYKQSIVLDELFSLEFKIRRKGANKPDIVRTIDDAGSTGTVVLIKAVLLMILLHKRTMSKKQRMPIPFFLDEVGVFGSNNRGQIVDIGKSLNFQLFTASPESMEEADVVYAILGSGPEDRIYVDPTHKRPKPKIIIGEEE